MTATQLMPIVVSCSAAWVYFDATRQGIGKEEGKGGLFNMSAGAWAVATLGLWLIGFPAYLIKRRRLIAQASERPVTPKWRPFKLGLFVMVAVWCVYSVVIARAALPPCEGEEASALVAQLISQTPALAEQGVAFKALNGVRETGFAEGPAGYRSCVATLVTSLGEEQLAYVLEWQDAASGTYQLRFGGPTPPEQAP